MGKAGQESGQESGQSKFGHALKLKNLTFLLKSTQKFIENRKTGTKTGTTLVQLRHDFDSNKHDQKKDQSDEEISLTVKRIDHTGR